MMINTKAVIIGFHVEHIPYFFLKWGKGCVYYEMNWFVFIMKMIGSEVQ